LEPTARDDLVHSEPDLQKSGNGCPQSAADDAGQDHGHEQQRTGQTVEIEGDDPSKQGAHKVLAFGANIPDSRPEGDGQTKANQQQWRRL
jgi:hypothetical protein